MLTATVANAKRQDGIEIEIQPPAELPKDKAYLKATAGPEYGSLEAARERRLERLHYEAHRQAYRKITEMAVAIVRPIEDERHFGLMLSFALLAYNLYRAMWLYWSISRQLILQSIVANSTS